MPDFNCSILCSPDVEEKLLDQLLVAFADDVFTSTPTFAHGVAHAALSTAEQVLGRARATMVQVLLKQDEWPALKALLVGEFAGTGLRYWLTPVLEEGVCA
ncbi:DUF3240 family protein [Dokdonella sp.]|uniref:DUF3240 family protein n=1 Tax=Dokdonella sp. TaxID=2291710 RepID=UPI002D19A60D|nr:DUF3240 family protein [Dokdonella sp.]HOZ25746.1 DUF3240 family protein [Hyphomonadaceae bacterium]HPN80628.1 DUF3240 family protein [Dokdonella sp.]